MALILAVNPGNRHSPTLARLARDLPGCELIGAESSAVAIKAIRKRVPDLVLLPAAPARGEADLLAHLKSIPGGVLTLKLPSVEKADPVDLARQIREMLTGVPVVTPAPPPAPPLPPPRRAKAPAPEPVPEPVPLPVPVIQEQTASHLVEAAETAVSWIRARRAQWSEPLELELPEPATAYEPGEPSERATPDREPSVHVAAPDPVKPTEPDEPQYYEPIGPYEALDLPEQIDPPPAPAPTRGRLPVYAAAAVVLIAIGGAAIVYWPRSSGSGSERADASSSAAPAGSPEVPAAPSPAPAPEPPPPEPQTPATGLIAVVVPFDVTITVDGQPAARDDQGRVVLAPGKHRLRLQNAERGYDATRTVQVVSAETTTLTLNPETTVAVTSNEPAEVLIDGTPAGDTPFEGRVSLGPHTITVKTATAERQLTIEATSKPVQLEVDFTKP